MILTSNRGFAGWGDDERVQAFLHRPIEGDWPYRLARCHLREGAPQRPHHVRGGHHRGRRNSDGRREVLGMTVGASEAETFWTDFLRSLARRGLRGVKLVISDGHEGIKAAIRSRAERLMAALPRALHAQCHGACRQDTAAHCLR